VQFVFIFVYVNCVKLKTMASLNEQQMFFLYLVYNQIIMLFF